MTEQSYAAIDLNRHGAPIYVQLSTLFRRFIVTGQWPVERQVPTHESLAAQFDVNPATVRKAMALLEEEGLVASRRRSGTRVIAKPAGGEYVEIPAAWAQVLRAFEGFDARILESRRVKSVPRPFHGGMPCAGGYRHARALYRRGGRALILEERYSKLPGGTKRETGHPLRRLASRARRAELTVRFGIADREVAQILEIPLNAPVAIAHLSVLAAGSCLVFESTCCYRGDAVCMREPIRFGRLR